MKTADLLAPTIAPPTDGDALHPRDAADAFNGSCADKQIFLQCLFDSAPEPMVILREDNCVVHVNREFERVFGYTLAQSVDVPLNDLIVPEGRQHETEILFHTVHAEGRASMETVRRTASGDLIDVSILISAVRLGERTIGLCVAYRDIREQKRLQAQLQHEALHDPLTSLPNRVLFLDRLAQTMARLQRRPDRNFAVVFLDVDRFKQVNDVHGHAAGDALLIEVTARLRRVLRPQDTIARFGGDEFALLLDQAGDECALAILANRVQTEMQRPVHLGDITVFVSASMGIALGATSYRDPEEIMHAADLAMYRAKANGKARHEFWQDHLETTLMHDGC